MSKTAIPIIVLLLLTLAACAQSLPEATLRATESATREATIGPALTYPPSPQSSKAEPTPVASPAQEGFENPIPRLQPGDSFTINYIHMTSETDGWSIAEASEYIDHILHSEDGGSTWQDVTPPQSLLEEGPMAAEGFFLDSQTAWITFKPYTVLWRTIDGGVSWQPARSGMPGDLGAMIWFRNAEDGWLMKFVEAGMSSVYSALYRTTNGGSSWEELFTPYNSSELQSFDKTGIAFVNNGDTGWVTRDSYGVMDGASVDWTADGGFTWKMQPLPPPSEEQDLFDGKRCGTYFPNLSDVARGTLLVRCVSIDGGKEGHRDYLYRTFDGGLSWSTSLYPGGTLILIDAKVYYALGRDIYLSRDAGQSWSKIKSVAWDGQFSFVNENLGWAIARADDAIALVRTDDGCRSFQEIQPKLLPPEVASEPPAAVATPFGGGNGQIAFISWRDSESSSVNDIYLMDYDGSNLTKLTDGSGLISNFTWSPDGAKIAFDSNRDGDSEIYVIDIATKGLLQLTDNNFADVEPDWSPDGQLILFSSYQEGEDVIGVMAPDGSGVQWLAHGKSPAWSPDGARIAFARWFDGLYLMNADGTGVRRLTDSSEHGLDWHPAWSPDGDRILFASNRHAPGDFLTETAYVMDADGNGIGQLNQGWGMVPFSWSTDGNWIVYTVDFFGQAEMFLMDASGLRNRPLTEGDNRGFHPLWHP